MSDDIKIVGLSELEKALDEFPLALQKSVMRGAIRSALKVIQDEARARVPVFSGALKKSIRVSVRVKDGEVVGFVKAGSRVKGGGKAGKTGDDRGAFYAHMVEFGTATHVIRAKRAKALGADGKFGKKVNHPGAQMRPFMRPALSTKSDAAMERFAEYIRAHLDKINKEIT